MPAARWHVDEPGGREALELGAELAFGERVETRYDLSQADVIVTLDCDLLGSGPGSVRYAHDFAARRAAALTEGAGRPAMSRLYAIESMPTITGTLADHRLPLCGEHYLGRGQRSSRRSSAVSRSALERRPRRRKPPRRRHRSRAISARGEAGASSSPASPSRPRCTRWSRR